MERYHAYIAGAFVETDTYSTVYDPATGAAVAEAGNCSEAQVNAAIDAAYEAQKTWRKLPACRRAEYLKAWAKELAPETDKLGELETLEQGKPLCQAQGECGCLPEFLDYISGWARRIEGEVLQSDDPNETVWICKEPLGVITCIIPWNFPMYIFVRKVAPALIAGNTVVIKPSSDTPLTAMAMAKLIDRAGFPAGVVNVVTGKSSVIGKALTSNPKVAMVSLTGSTGAGQEVMRNCAESMIRVSLELGGKAPSVIMDDADLDLAVSTLLAAKAKNAGQVCTAPERVYVQRGVADAFIEKLAAAMKKLTYGNGMENPSYGPQINKKAVETIHGMVERAVADGANLVMGGVVPEGPGAFYPPTLLTNCRQDMEIMREEIFGPVLPVKVFDTAEEALTLVNDCKYGLTTVLYTNNMNIMLRFAKEVECGELFVNRMQGEAYNGYHSGWKMTGIGGDDGKHGLEEFMQTRTVYVVNS